MNETYLTNDYGVIQASPYSTVMGGFKRQFERSSLAVGVACFANA